MVSNINVYKDVCLCSFLVVVMSFINYGNMAHGCVSCRLHDTQPWVSILRVLLARLLVMVVNSWSVDNTEFLKNETTVFLIVLHSILHLNCCVFIDCYTLKSRFVFQKMCCICLFYCTETSWDSFVLFTTKDFSVLVIPLSLCLWHCGLFVFL